MFCEYFQFLSDGGTKSQQSPKNAPQSGLAQAMVEVPMQYFREDFTLDWELLGAIDNPDNQQAVEEELSSQLVSNYFYGICRWPF